MKVYITNSGPAISFDVTAIESDVLLGKTFVDSSGNLKIGTLEFTGNAIAANVLETKTFYSNSVQQLSGSMKNNGAYTISITPGTSAQSQTIPEGYHNGSGVVTVAAAPLSLVDGTAVASDVLSGKTFFSDSYNVKTGTMANRGAVTTSVGFGGSYTILAGYHNGQGKVTGPTLNGKIGHESGNLNIRNSSGTAIGSVNENAIGYQIHKTTTTKTFTNVSGTFTLCYIPCYIGSSYADSL